MLIFQKPTSHKFTALKIAFITGLSDPTRCALSQKQRRFLSALDIPEADKIYYNFPYLPAFGSGETSAPLWQASFANYRQFRMARQNQYLAAARRHLETFFASAETIIFLAGSCGLEILNHAIGRHPPEKPMHVFALGPVARRRPVFPHTLIQGQRDYISKLFFRDVDVIIPGVGHMDYLDNSAVFHFINERLCSSILK